MPEIPDSLALTWTLVSATMDADHARWNRTCEARRAAGQKGGAAKAANRQKEKGPETDHKKAEQPETDRKEAEKAEQPEREKDGLEAAAEPTLVYLSGDFRAQKYSAAAVRGFCAFYRTFPRHVGPRDAVKAYGKAVAGLRRGGMDEAAAIAAIQEGAERYAAEQADSEARYIAHPASWLNAGRWADERTAPNRRMAGRGGRLATIARAAGLCCEDEAAEVPALEEASHD